jgi:hypothetical protein
MQSIPKFDWAMLDAAHDGRNARDYLPGYYLIEELGPAGRQVISFLSVHPLKAARV